jgi:hypothetical protein
MGSWLPADQFSTKVCLNLFTFSQYIHVSVGHPAKMVWGLRTQVENTVRFQVLPTIVKLFASNDRAIRVSLLQHIDQFGESLAAQTVDEQVCDIFYMGICICVSRILIFDRSLWCICRFSLMLPLGSLIHLLSSVNWHWSQCLYWHQKWVARTFMFGLCLAWLCLLWLGLRS